MKLSKLIVLTMAVIFLFISFIPMSFSAQKTTQVTDAAKKKSRDTEPPIAMVVNNSGKAIYQVKIGNVIFQENLSGCFDGCSTGFKNVKTGRNLVYIKATALASWQTIGSIGMFETGKKYAVNFRFAKGNILCAELFQMFKTDLTFNTQRSKRKILQICKKVVIFGRP